MTTLTFDYPEEVLWALDKSLDDFADEAKLLLAVKLYETGRLTAGLAAKFAGIPRSLFFYSLSQHKISPIEVNPDELEEDFANAKRASRSE